MSTTTLPGCSVFSCHVDCATGCATDDQPFNHPDLPNYKYHPASFDEDELRSRNHSVDSSAYGEDKGIDSSIHEPNAEASSLMRFVLWALNVKTDTGA